MSKLIVSSEANLTTEELEEELIKAAFSVKLKQEKKELRDVYLKAHKDRVSKAVHLVFLSMLSEIESIIKEDKT